MTRVGRSHDTGVPVVPGPNRRAGGNREQILDAADTLFRERGFASVSVQEIAEAAGLTKGAPYYHFTDKEELLVEVLVRSMERVSSGAIDRLEGDEPLAERLERVVEFLLTVAAPDLSRLPGDAAMYISPQRLAAFAERMVPPHEVFTTAFAARPEEWQGVAPSLAARVFIATVLGHIDPSPFGSLQSPIEPAIIVRAFLHGIFACASDNPSGGTTARV